MKLKIIVADSGAYSDRDQDRLSSVLEDTDFTVSRCTANLNDAVRLVLSRQFDILICINRAPEYIAAKLLRLTGTAENRIPSIIISEQDDSQRMRECFLLGAIDFLAEPIPPEDLLQEPHGQHIAGTALLQRDAVIPGIQLRAVDRILRHGQQLRNGDNHLVGQRRSHALGSRRGHIGQRLKGSPVNILHKMLRDLHVSVEFPGPEPAFCL